MKKENIYNLDKDIINWEKKHPNTRYIIDGKSYKIKK